MSAYLDRLKQFKNDKYFQHTPDSEPSKPSEVPFEPFEGMGTGHIEKKINDKYFQHTPDSEPSKPTKGAFDGFDGTGMGHIEKIFTESESSTPHEPDCIDTLAIDYAELKSLMAELCRIVGHTDHTQERMMAACRYLYPYQVAAERDYFRLRVELATTGRYWLGQPHTNERAIT